MEEEAKVYNSHVLIDNHGVIKEVYRKTHLFDVNIKGGAVLKESEYVIPGTCLSPPVASPVGKIGMQVVSFSKNFLSAAQLVHKCFLIRQS